MKFILNLLFFLCCLVNLYANKIIFGVSGIAKVGNSCFLSIYVKDNSNTNIKELDFSVFTTDKTGNLIGKSKINLYKLNKHQSYNTSIPIKMQNTMLCNEIRTVNIYANKCDLENQNLCKDLIKVDKSFNKEHLLKTVVLESSNYFDIVEKKYFIKEFGIYLQVINSKFAKKYNIQENTYGLIVTDVNQSNVFKKGDLIFEAEMIEIKNVYQLKHQLKNIFNSKKEYVLINFIRDNNKKLVAVKLK